MYVNLSIFTSTLGNRRVYSIYEHPQFENGHRTKVYTKMNYPKDNLKSIPILNATCLGEINSIG
jgi:hypothetical protein